MGHAKPRRPSCTPACRARFASTSPIPPWLPTEASELRVVERRLRAREGVLDRAPDAERIGDDDGGGHSGNEGAQQTVFDQVFAIFLAQETDNQVLHGTISSSSLSESVRGVGPARDACFERRPMTRLRGGPLESRRKSRTNPAGIANASSWGRNRVPAPSAADCRGGSSVFPANAPGKAAESSPAPGR